MDWDKINTLLSVVHQAAAAGMEFNYIGGAARAEIHRLASIPSDPPVEESNAPATPARRV